MHTYNTTVDGTGLGASPNITTRIARAYTFDVSGGSLQPGDRVAVQRLSADGSDAISGISWDGWSYNYELDRGKPVRLSNVTVGEYVVVGADGTVVVSVLDASAVVLSFTGNGTVGGGGSGGETVNMGMAMSESGALRVAVSVVSVIWLGLAWMLW